ncbi:uncharacterized protein EAF02_009722 [Botrytis sinoallii]|uniref:uncharacterized protein n=1 Tax=Botrytis sinoallii TaxID=1463999 RepID=UPI001901D993|nr:uncharacterized protein EAF02_009722 [Botrytis sinoallii]KAF7867531.1 hypothetical protein EAF02_009722 [Botrytis sinoallii]
MSMPTTGLVVPPGQSPPFAVVTSTDHSAWIIIATALGLSCLLVFSGIKSFARTSMGKGVSYDEICLLASTLLAAIQSSVVLGACAKGLGKSIELVSVKNQAQIEQMWYTSLLLFVISLGLSKTSVVVLLGSLTPDQKHKKIFRSVIGLTAAWTVASLFAVALQCNLAHPWKTIGQRCDNVSLRWQVISAFDIVFELAYVALSFYLVWSLRTSKSNKTIVVVAFGFRLPVIIAIAYRLARFDVNGLTTNPMFLEDEFIIWTQSEMNYSVIAAIIPSLRPFVKNLSTYYGQELGGRSGYTLEDSENYQLSNLGSAMRNESHHRESRIRADVDPDDYKFRVWANEPELGARKGKNPGEGGSKLWNKAGEEGTDGLSVGSSDSQRMIIKKDTTWTVQMD